MKTLKHTGVGKMLFELNSEIVQCFIFLKKDGKTPSEILREIFSKFGEVSPPVMADYFEHLYGGEAMDYMAALGAWWHDSSTDISDTEFDRRIDRVLKKHK